MSGGRPNPPFRRPNSEAAGSFSSMLPKALDSPPFQGCRGLAHHTGLVSRRSKEQLMMRAVLPKDIHGQSCMQLAQ